MKKIISLLVFVTFCSSVAHAQCEKVAKLFFENLKVSSALKSSYAGSKPFSAIPGYCILYYTIKNEVLNKELLNFVVTDGKYMIPALLTVNPVQDMVLAELDDVTLPLLSPKKLGAYLYKKGTKPIQPVYIFTNFLSDWLSEQLEKHKEFKGNIYVVPHIMPNNAKERYMLKVFYAMLDFGFSVPKTIEFLSKIPQIYRDPKGVKSIFRGQMNEKQWGDFEAVLSTWTIEKTFNKYNEPELNIVLPMEFVIKNNRIFIRHI